METNWKCYKHDLGNNFSVNFGIISEIDLYALQKPSKKQCSDSLLKQYDIDLKTFYKRFNVPFKRIKNVTNVNDLETFCSTRVLTIT